MQRRPGHETLTPLFVNSLPIHSVRPALREDAAIIAEIHVAAWKIAYRGQLPDEFLDELQVEERTKAWNDLLEGPGSTLLAEDEHRAVTGFCQILQSRDQDADHTVAEVPFIYVRPSSWRIGVGRSLCESALRLAEQAGFETVTLWVLESNKGARHFYESMGFHLDGASRSEDRPGFRMNELRYRHALD